MVTTTQSKPQLSQKSSEIGAYNFGQETWKIGKKLSLYHCHRGCHKGSLVAFAELFGDILNTCKGDVVKEGVLFYCMHSFSYGYNFPCFPWEYVQSQCDTILTSKPGDQCRTMFNSFDDQ